MNRVEGEVQIEIRKGIAFSGKRRVFKSGAQRDVNETKGRFDLLPMHALIRAARIYQHGGEKHGIRNWEKGMPLSACYDSGMRHLALHIAGYDDEDHLGQALWNLASGAETEERIRQGILPQELDDLPHTFKGKIPPTAPIKRQLKTKR